MSTELWSPPAGHRSAIVYAVYAGLVLTAFVLLFLSFPRIAAYSLILPVSGQIDPFLTKGESIPGPLLDRAVVAYKAASEWQSGDADLQQTLARLYLRQFGEKGISSGARQIALKSALERIDLSISAAPNRHFSWSLRAEILRLMNRPSEEIAAALRMSYLLGPREASSMLMRSSIIFERWENLSPSMHEIVREDLRGLWQSPQLRRNVASMYLRQTLVSLVRIREILIHSRKDAQAFDAYLRAELRRR